MKHKIKKIIEYLEKNFDSETINSGLGLDEKLVSGFSPIDDTKENTISWALNFEFDINEVKSNLLIVNKNEDIEVNQNIVISKVENPRLAFAKIMKEFYSPKKEPCIHETALIDNSAKIGRNVSIGPYCVINENVTIGDNTSVESHVLIEANVSIGNNCYIKSNTTIGQDGFGVVKEQDGSLVKIVHLGTVNIGNNVELGSMNTVNKGTLKNTVIDDGVKTDDHVHIAHNCYIGKNVVITPGVILCGSVNIEEESWLGAQCTIIEGVNVRKNSIIGIGSVVLRDTNPNCTYIGNPARQLIK